MAIKNLIKIEQAATILKEGGIVAFPTEILYGIGASIKKPQAIKRLFSITDRPRNASLQILVASLEDAKRFIKFNRRGLELVDRFWPGPFTLVLYKKRSVSSLVSGGGKKVGVRMPINKTVQELIRQSGPIVAVGAYKPGQPVPVSVNQVKKSFPGVDFVLPFVFPETVKYYEASRVIDATRGITILRHYSGESNWDG